MNLTKSQNTFVQGLFHLEIQPSCLLPFPLRVLKQCQEPGISVVLTWIFFISDLAIALPYHLSYWLLGKDRELLTKEKSCQLLETREQQSSLSSGAVILGTIQMGVKGIPHKSCFVETASSCYFDKGKTVLTSFYKIRRIMGQLHSPVYS